MPIRKTTVLTADDDPQLLRLVARNLELEDYQVLVASDGQQALEQIVQQAPDLVLLDVMMPRMDGFTVCQRVREFSAVPIIIVTARGQEHDKVRGLDLGADDYLTKPFSIEELLARVRAVLRRAQFTASEQAHSMRTATIGDLTIEYAQHLVRMGEREIELTPTEYRILAYLAQNAGRVVTQDLLLEHIKSPLNRRQCERGAKRNGLLGQLRLHLNLWHARGLSPCFLCIQGDRNGYPTIKSPIL